MSLYLFIVLFALKFTTLAISFMKHLQDRHTPIYGDDIYGLADWNKHLSKTQRIDRPLLHAWKLEIDHPVSGDHMEFIAPMAPDMMQIARNVWPQGEHERPDLFENETSLGI